jgi:hypothetical protein
MPWHESMVWLSRAVPGTLSNTFVLSNGFVGYLRQVF